MTTDAPLITDAEIDLVQSAGTRAGLSEEFFAQICEQAKLANKSRAAEVEGMPEELTVADMRELMARVTSGTVDHDLLGNPITNYDVLLMGAYRDCILRLLNAARSDIRHSASTRIVALEAKVAELEKWQQNAFLAHSNIDLDIESALTSNEGGKNG